MLTLGLRVQGLVQYKHIQSRSGSNDKNMIDPCLLYAEIFLLQSLWVECVRESLAQKSKIGVSFDIRVFETNDRTYTFTVYNINEYVKYWVLESLLACRMVKSRPRQSADHVIA